MRLRRAPKPALELNITPLIDVVFMLLVFFMLATNFSRFRLIGVETPEETKVVSTSEGSVVILLQTDGGFAFDGKPAERAGLRRLVGAVLERDENRSFLVRPEPGVSLQAAIDAYDEARSAGAKAVSFSQPKAEAGP